MARKDSTAVVEPPLKTLQDYTRDRIRRQQAAREREEAERERVQQERLAAEVERASQEAAAWEVVRKLSEQEAEPTRDELDVAGPSLTLAGVSEVLLQSFRRLVQEVGRQQTQAAEDDERLAREIATAEAAADKKRREIEEPHLQLQALETRAAYLRGKRARAQSAARRAAELRAAQPRLFGIKAAEASPEIRCFGTPGMSPDAVRQHNEAVAGRPSVAPSVMTVGGFTAMRSPVAE